MSGDDGEESVVVLVGRGWETGFDDGASYGDGVIFLDVKLACNRRGDCGRNVVPVIWLV